MKQTLKCSITISIVILLVFVITINSRAQSPNEQIEKIDSLNKISKRFVRSNYDSSIIYLQQAIDLSDKIEYTEGKICALTNQADANLYLNDIDSSILISEQIIDLAIGNSIYEEYLFTTYYRLCIIYHNKGQYAKAIDVADMAIVGLGIEANDKYLSSIYNLKGLILKRTGEFKSAQKQFISALKHIGDDDYYLRSITLTNLGIINRNLEQYTQALDYYNQALESSEAIDDSIGIGQLFQNIAAVYSDMEENKKSLSYNLKAKSISKNGNHLSIAYATLLNNIGLNYEGLEKPDSASKYLKDALELSIVLNDTYGIADTKINIGRVNLNSSSSNLCRMYVEEGLASAKSIEADDLIIEGYEVLIDCEILDQNYKSAFHTQKTLNALRDSVYNIEKVNSINELQEKYESQKKEQRIVLLETENELKDSEVKQKRMQRNGLIGFAIIVVLIALIILYYLRKTRKAKNKIEILQREIHHRVKNNLAIIQRLADVSRQNLDDPSAQSAICDLTSRIDSMTQVHAQLYRKSDITEVDFKDYLSELCQNINAEDSNFYICPFLIIKLDITIQLLNKTRNKFQTIGVYFFHIETIGQPFPIIANLN